MSQTPSSPDRPDAASFPESGRKRESTVAEVYERIYGAILDNRLKPGTKLVEERLSEIFAVSRPRIREVLARLAHEQIVELYPQRGAYVAKPTIEKAIDIFEARRVIEPAVVRRLCGNLTPEKLERLNAHEILERDARARQDKRSIIRLSGEFHVLLSELSGNAELARIMRELSTLTCLVIFLYNLPISTTCRHDEHALIIDAIAARDVALAESLTLQHLDHIEQSVKLEPPEESTDLEDVFRVRD
jgi:DNA-binding GntR family transcriptional regulator